MSALETYVIITIQEMQTGLIKHLVRALLSPSNANNLHVAHRHYTTSLFSFLNRLKRNLRCAKCSLSYY